MNKKNSVLLIIAVFVLGVATLVEARPTWGDNAAYRAGRGVKNIAIAPTDIFNTVEDIRFKEGYVQALTYGVIKGTFRAVGRVGQGIYELITFYKSEQNDQQFSPTYDSAIIHLQNY